MVFFLLIRSEHLIVIFFAQDNYCSHFTIRNCGLQEDCFEWGSPRNLWQI